MSARALTRPSIAAALTALLAPSTGLAAAPPSFCAAPYSNAQWQADMDSVTTNIHAFKLNAAAETLAGVRKQLQCLDTIADRAMLGRYGRQMSIIFFFQQEEDAAIRWANLQRFAAPGLSWTKEGLTATPPYRDMLSWVDEPPVGGSPDASLVYPKKGAIFLNGTLLTTPTARAEVPGLVQVSDKLGNITTAFWQDGARFRPDILGPPGGKPPAAPDWFQPQPFDAVADADENPFGFGDDADVGDEGDEPMVATEPAVADAGTDPVHADAVTEPVVADVVTEPVVTEPTRPDPVTLPKPPKAPSTSSVRVVPLAAGGGLGVVAGALYGLAAINAAKISDHSLTVEELKSARGTANALTITSGVLGAAAIGVGVTAVVDEHGWGLGWRARF